MTSYSFPPGHRYSRTDYWPFRGVHNTTVSRCGGSPSQTPVASDEDGALGPRGVGPYTGNAIVNISDGTSNTLMVTEIAARGLAAYIRGKNVLAIPSTMAGVNPVPLTGTTSLDLDQTSGGRGATRTARPGCGPTRLTRPAPRPTSTAAAR